MTVRLLSGKLWNDFNTLVEAVWKLLKKFTCASVVLGGVEGHAGGPSHNGSTELILSEVEVLTMTLPIDAFPTTAIENLLSLQNLKPKNDSF